MLNMVLLRSLAAVASILAGFATSPASAQKQPNILVILVDDMGWSDTSPYGGEIHTPNIAQIASQGVALTNFHVSAYCAPTRGMLLTGVDNHQIGLGNMIELAADNQSGKPGYEGHLNGRVPTIATRLRQAGYHTYMAGKWHLGKTPETMPASQGFEQSVGVLEGGADNWENKSYTPVYKSVHFFENRGELKLPESFYSSQFYADRMINYIESNRRDERPFFGYLAFQAVHQPHQAPADFIERYTSTYQSGWSAISKYRYLRQVESGLMPPGLTLTRGAIVPDWPSLTEDQQKRGARQMAVYAGMVEYMDYSIGRVMDYLRRNRMLDNTVVVFLSDNGAEAAEIAPLYPEYYAANFDMRYERMGLKGSYSEYGPGWAGASMTPFSNYKGSASEGGLRAQFAIRYPGKVRTGARSGAFAHVLDVAPTLLRYAGVQGGKQDPKLQTGRSMAAMLSGAERLVHPADKPVGYEVAGSSALFQGDYKLQRSAPPFGDATWRLYDLTADPTESRDLSGAMADRKAQMLRAYQAYATGVGLVEVPEGYHVIKQAQANAERKK